MKNAENELSLIQEKYTEICKESQKWKKEKETSDIEALKLKKDNDELKSKLKEARTKAWAESREPTVPSERKYSSNSDRDRPEKEAFHEKEKEKTQERSGKPICAKYIMGLCYFGDRCWNTHELTEEQVERAIEAGKARRERDKSERRRNTSSQRRQKRDEDEESKRGQTK